MSERRIEKLLRGVPEAERIEIECVEQGGEDSYIVCVWPKGKGKHSVKPPIKRVFTSEAQTLAFLKEVL